ncbi:MAG TPA: hypothetical protein VFA30_02635 [Gaiellaceae bacterium]|nr:hypothetical protein [Gaiellaceae bacterium]
MVSWRLPLALLVIVLFVAIVGYAAVPGTVHGRSGTTSNAAWAWPGGLPGSAPDETTVQPVELQAAALAAARDVLDSTDVRVIAATRPGRRGALAVLAARTLDEKPQRTCLAGLLQGEAPVRWVCPGPHTLSHRYVFAAAARMNWPGSRDPVYLAGVARGDVTRIVLLGGASPRLTVYTRSTTWGEFDLAEWVRPGGRLLVYVGPRLVETVPLDLRVGQQRVIR